MKRNIKTVNDMNGLIEYFVSTLNWKIDLDYFEDIEDITYDFDAEDIGLKEEAFAKIKTLRQLRPLVDGQRWGIFCVEFDSRKFEITALRKILSGLIPTRRNSAEHAVWDQKDLLFICFWGEGDNRTIGIAHFEDKETGLPQIKMIYCAPAVEDFTQIRIFEDRLRSLKWPEEFIDHDRWQEEWSSAFKTAYRQTINDVSTLTAQLAVEARGIRDRILSILEIETRNGYVHLLYEKFKNTLIHDMTETQFADMYAQTVVYGLFSARCMDDTQDDFSAAEAVECIPSTNPFLKSLMRECLGSQNRMLSFDELEIGNVVDLLLHTKTDAIIQDFNRQTGGGREDPVIHFYEEFLEAYDKTQKVQRGVYYTPQPVVNFIVRAVDSIIKSEFGFEDGLASTDTKKLTYYRDSKKKKDGHYTQVKDIKDVPAIQVLDPSTGTGTFIRQSILQIYENFKDKNKTLDSVNLRKAWNDYVPKHLLPRLNAFELMMAPYAVAHMKLAMVLKDTGYEFESDVRLNVYLTNTLEEPGDSDMQITMFDDPLAIESVAANAVKKNKGINIVIGNPPYSGESANNGDWAQSLIEPYKYEPGGVVKLQERNSKWINDDYVKFIRFAQTAVDSSDYGMIAYINPHGFSDNPTFRGMRWNLLQSFDKIYVLDLHGNSKKKEKAPDGSKDENVFDIQQGVCILIALKKNDSKSKKGCVVYHADLFGLREKKYAYLSNSQIKEIKWDVVDCHEPYYLFKIRDEENLGEYEKGFGVNDLFVQNSIGVVSARDNVVVGFKREDVLEKISTFCDEQYTDKDIRKLFFPNKKEGKYLAGDTRGWSLSDARKTIRGNKHESLVERFLYRPFDWRYIYYTKEMVDWSREQVMRNFINHENVALIAPRQTKDHIGYYITEAVCGHKTCSAYDVNTIFPLFIFSEQFNKTVVEPNIDKDILARFEKTVGLKMITNKDPRQGFTAWNMFDYIFAVVNSNKYKKEYEEFLKVEFPKIPYPENKDYFFKMSKLGERLRHNQLLHFDIDDSVSCSFSEGDEGTHVDRVKYDGKGTVKINKTSSFMGVSPMLWNSFVGGYKPLQKWLQDRKGRTLSKEDIEHYRKMTQALAMEKEIVREIDDAIKL